MTNTFFNQEWVNTLQRLHQEMLEENALYEELADENELSDDDIKLWGEQLESNQPEQLARSHSQSD